MAVPSWATSVGLSASNSSRRTARRQQELGRRQQDGLLDGPHGSLVGGIECAEGVDLVTEELDPDGERGRRREDVDDAAAAGELATTRHLSGGRIAEIQELAEQLVLAEATVDDELTRRPREIVGRDRVLDERLDARHEDPGAATPPGRQGGDARGGLIGDQLAALVGEGGPRF